jgi:hypothetical protein
LAGYEASKNWLELPPWLTIGIRTVAVQRGHRPTNALRSALMYARMYTLQHFISVPRNGRELDAPEVGSVTAKTSLWKGDLPRNRSSPQPQSV